MARKRAKAPQIFSALRKAGFEVAVLHHAEAILLHDMPEAVAELERALLDVRIPIEELVRGGGGESEPTQRLRHALADVYGWKKHKFEVQRTVDGVLAESVTHEIDHVRASDAGKFALEIEWNNKDPFFDRDLENFKRLHAEGAIAVGSIVTRGTSLQAGIRGMVADFARAKRLTTLEQIGDYYTPTPRQRKLIASAATRHGSFADGWANAFVADKFGEATTHWRKLEERMQRGVGNPCPLLLIGIPEGVITA